MNVKFYACLEFPGSNQSVRMKISVCLESMQKIAQEIVSHLNWHTTQVRFGVHEPTPEQLLENYVVSGGMWRCIDKMDMASASLC